MIVFIYPASEPASCSSWVGDVIAERGLGVAIESGHNNVSEVIAACGASDARCVFFGGTTQLGWLFDSAEKRSAFKSLRGKRILLANELVFAKRARPEFRDKFANAVACATHLVGFDRGINSEEYRQLQLTGLPTMKIAAFPFAFEKCRKTTEFSDRTKLFLFVGTAYGEQRMAILKALKNHGLVADVKCPKSNPEMLIALYNAFSGVINLRSGHGEIERSMPRPLEAASCGCYVLDLQRFEASDVDAAVAEVRSVRWDVAERDAAAQRADAARFDCVRMIPEICQWAL